MVTYYNTHVRKACSDRGHISSLPVHTKGNEVNSNSPNPNCVTIEKNGRKAENTKLPTPNFSTRVDRPQSTATIRAPFVACSGKALKF